MSEELNVGDRIKDNDPRMGNRVLTVTAIEAGEVLAQSKSGFCRNIRISRKRIFIDGKPRRYGFNKVIA